MTNTEIERRLLSALHSEGFIEATELLVEEMQESGASIEAVLVFLRFMEENPTVEFGMPGPLVHFVEEFYKNGYEAALVESISRCPTPHTVWMLNRVINGEKDRTKRESLIEALRMVSLNPTSSEEVVNLSVRFYKIHQKE